jgi:hypothetical protein
VPLTRSLSLHVLTCPSLCTLQRVSAPHPFSFFSYPHLPVSLCALQEVSGPRSLAFILCPSLSFLCALQLVSAPHSLSFALCPHSLVALRSLAGEYPSLTFFSYPHLAFALRSPGSESLSHASFLSVTSRIRSVPTRTWVPPRLFSSFPCPHLSVALRFKVVSAPGPLAFFPRLHLSAALYSPVGECLWLAHFLFCVLT